MALFANLGRRCASLSARTMGVVVGRDRSYSTNWPGPSGGEQAADGVRHPSLESSPASEEEHELPWRTRKSLVERALEFNSSEDYSNQIISKFKEKGFEMKLIDVNRTVKVTKGGKVQSYTALAVCGNGAGVVGFGKGKAADVAAAVQKAYARSVCDLHYFESYRGSTVYHEQVGKYEQTKLHLWPAKNGTGIVAGEIVGSILKFAGFQNVKSKVIGSRHPHNTVKATFKTLGLIKTPSVVAALKEGQELAPEEKEREVEERLRHQKRLEEGLFASL